MKDKAAYDVVIYEIQARCKGIFQVIILCTIACNVADFEG